MHKLVACGLSHKTAPLHLREKMTPAIGGHEALLVDLIAETPTKEAAILSTCHRTELYCCTDEPDVLLPWLAQRQQLPITQLQPYTYTYHNQKALYHTMRVACGLDSMMLGEPQILGQMKQAYHAACSAKTIQGELRDLFRQVFATSKRIRTHTTIGVNPISIAFAAAGLIKQSFTDLSQSNILLIGSGDTIKLVAKYLQQANAKKFAIASRTEANSHQLAKQLKGQYLAVNDIPAYLPNADLVISATACPLPFINKAMVEQALSTRQQPMVFVDLAVPRDIEPTVGSLADVRLYNIDDLQDLVLAGMNERLDAAKQAEQIINQEVANYLSQQRTAQANDIIRQYRDNMAKLADQEVQRALQSIGQGITSEQAMNELGRRLVNKLAHQPTMSLRKAADAGNNDLLDLAHHLFS